MGGIFLHGILRIYSHVRSMIGSLEARYVAASTKLTCNYFVYFLTCFLLCSNVREINTLVVVSFDLVKYAAPLKHYKSVHSLASCQKFTPLHFVPANKREPSLYWLDIYTSYVSTLEFQAAPLRSDVPHVADPRDLHYYQYLI